MSKVVTDSNKDIHIHLDNGVPNSITSGAGAMEKYVMWQNQQLTAELNQMTMERNQLLAEKDELCRENTKYGSSGRYTKSLLRNLVELNSYSSELSEKYKLLYENNFKRLETIKNHTSTVLRFTSKTTLTTVGVCWKYNVNVYFLMFFMLLSILSYFSDIWLNEFYVKLTVKDPSTTMRIKTIEAESKKIIASQDFLDEYIENLN